MDIISRRIDVSNKQNAVSPIAVTGIGCWYPGANSAQQLWENILARRREFRKFLDQRLPVKDYYDPDPSIADKIYTSRAAYIDGFQFDWAKHRIPQKTYKGTDIVQWLALEVAEQALADAGFNRESIPRDRTGVILGNSLTGEQSRANSMRLRWPFVKKVMLRAAQSMAMHGARLDTFIETSERLYKSVFPEVNEDTLQGGLSNTVAGRVANYFDLHGGGYVVDGACSSSLLAVCTAAAQLSNNDLDMAVAGGVDISLDTFELIGFAKTSALTATDMHVYDRRGAGFLPGEGCGFVVLKRLSDAMAAGDMIYAILRGWGISSDGKGGITAPSSDGQALAIKRAYQKAGYSPHQLDFIEGHGTGTTRGDKTELEGVAKAMKSFGDPGERRCGMTSFKSIVGHTKAAAGIGAFIKASLAANRRVLPPTAGCSEPNSVFEGDGRCLYPILQGKVFDSSKTMRIGISAMGFGGINSHVTLESADPPSSKLEPSIEERALLVSAQSSELFVYGANSITELSQLVDEAADIVVGLSISDLTDYAAYLGNRVNADGPARCAVIADTPEKLVEGLLLIKPILSEQRFDHGNLWFSPQRNAWVSLEVKRTRLGFLLPGQGCQQLAMARTLVERFQWARDLVDLADKVTEDELGITLSNYIYPPLDKAIDREQIKKWKQDLARTEIAQPAICLAEILYSRYLASLGLKPSVVGGHSLGELTAFYLAGAFDEESLFRLAAMRGRVMSLSSKIKGTMAAISAPEAVVNDLLKKVKGDATIANLNSPNQTIISGDKKAVGQAVEIAKKRNIGGRELNVSGAFHSKLMDKAVAEFKPLLNIPEQIENRQVDLISSTNGRIVKSGTNLHQHFCDQILAQVNFIELAKAMHATCDLMIEVGPGRILSGLASQIFEDPNGCVPVAAKPTDGDKDLNSVLAMAFTSGVNIKWSALYDRRLTRPFKESSQRIFIENPCERPFAEIPSSSVKSDVQDSRPLIGSRNFTEKTGLTENKLSHYLDKRGDFLVQVIKADINFSSKENDVNFIDLQDRSSTNGEIMHNGTKKSTESIDENPPKLEEEILEIIANKTGFPVKTISLQSRLLDDLNLDSIKAGQVIAAAALKAGVAGKIEASQFANATLQEIVNVIKAETADENLPSPSEKISPVIQTSEASSQKLIVEDLVLDLIAESTGFPKEMLSLESRLLDDLNLDSIKAGQLISNAASKAGVQGKINPTQFANAKVEEIAKQIYKLNGDYKDGFAQTPVQKDNGDSRNTLFNKSIDWVRNYIVDCVPEKTNRENDLSVKLNGQKILIITSKGKESKFARILAKKLKQCNADILISEFENASLNTIVQNGNLSHVIGILNDNVSQNLDESQRLRSMVLRLQETAVSTIRSDAQHLTFIQFGEGYFGVGKVVSNPELCCAASFSRSIALERDRLGITVVDLSRLLPYDIAVGKVLAELYSGKTFNSAGYNSLGERFVQKLNLQHPALNTPRKLTWNPSDVILVTGGAKGITAECALALASRIKAKFILVGSSSLPADSSQMTDSENEIATTLGRFKELEVEHAYYSCNLTDENAVETLISTIQSELGAITAVIHGAGVNKARLIEHVSVEKAVEEVGPKILGIQYILKALDQSPPKLVVGFSSVIGVVGMPGNAWYAFSNEALDLILRKFEQNHPENSVISIAYSVWGEVGMGHRMGAVENLDKMGIGAIPTKEGVSRFLELIEGDPDVKQVIVTSRLGDLKTWKALINDSHPPKSFRFIEEIISINSQVELITRTRLTLERDLYLNDHDFNGSFLFPTVFGLEAMAQASCVLAGHSPNSISAIENINLTRPIVVDSTVGEEIEIRAFAHEADHLGREKVYVEIGTGQTGFGTNHFSGVVVFGERPESTVRSLPQHDPLNIDPKKDLYGNYLFQGPLFQQLKEIYTVKPEQVIFSCESRTPLPRSMRGFNIEDDVELILGDPFYRDVLLQSVQLPATPEIVLPISIERIDFFHDSRFPEGSKIASSILKEKDEKDYSWNVEVCNKDGLVVEKLTNYKVRIVNDPSIKTKPSIKDLLADRNARATRRINDEKQVLDLISSLQKINGLEKITFSISYLPGLGSLSRRIRHKLEKPLITKALRPWKKANLGFNRYSRVKRLKSGKPVFDGEKTNHLNLSITHDDDYCLCVIGPGSQGCDLEPIIPRSKSEWIGMLGESRQNLLEELLRFDRSIDSSGLRVWCALEAVIKAAAWRHIKLSIKEVHGSAILLQARQKDRVIDVWTTPIQLSVGPVRILAIVANGGNDQQIIKKRQGNVLDSIEAA